MKKVAFGLIVLCCFMSVTCFALAATQPWQIGSTGYDTLQDAVKAASSGDVITLTQNTTGSADIGNENGTQPKSLTIDLGEYTLTQRPAVGSTGTVTNGMRVLANSSLTIRNGVIQCGEAGGNIKVGIANYGTLALTDVRMLSGPDVWYTINNRGNLTLSGSTSVETGKAVKKIAITNDPYNYIYTNTNATLTITDPRVTVGVVQAELYGNSQNKGNVDMRISAGTIAEVKDDGNNSLTPIAGITGGAYGKPVDSRFVQNGTSSIQVSGDSSTPYYLGASATQRMAQAKSGDVIQVLQASSTALTLPAGVKVINQSGQTLKVNGQSLIAGGSLVVPAAPAAAIPDMPKTGDETPLALLLGLLLGSALLGVGFWKKQRA